MLKNILKLDGAQELSKEMQKSVKGKGGELMACLCPDGQLVVAHGDSCDLIISQFCALDA
ncbi:hypothetical protein NAT51_02800 [Flavobacterium amniphilum]|uniref:hypothetical protein n=1 Tax=Flavobacterium amniphilum TaxID=1834035 RepID=UPI00202A3C27|nr:hypothetical protein [Flavobacterium amniphilum]MCL9804433.1 hypothetical protein [Flavobacterium amniphilum]